MGYNWGMDDNFMDKNIKVKHVVYFIVAFLVVALCGTLCYPTARLLWAFRLLFDSGVLQF